MVPDNSGETMLHRFQAKGALLPSEPRHWPGIDPVH
jgi:hypothetical protein